MSQKGKLKLLKTKTNANADIEFKDLDINPLIRDYMIREAFNMFDEDHSGEIDKREFVKLITSLGLELNEKKINELMKEMDKDGSGTIDFEEFSAMMANFQFGKESQIQQHLESAFNDYDKDMDNLISTEDFIKVSEELDSVPMKKEDAEMFVTFCKHFGKEKKIESLNDNGVSKEEFINALNCMGFLFENKDDGKGRGTSGILGTSNSGLDKSQGAVSGIDSDKNTSKKQSIVKSLHEKSGDASG